MNRSTVRTLSSLFAIVVIAANNAFASLTPPPKEWAMFPQDEPPPAQAPQAPKQNGQNPAQPNAPTNTVAGPGGQSSGVISAPNTPTAPHREFPLLWMLLTAGLSLGAVAASGSLILRKDALTSMDADEIPVVSELQEIRA